MQSVILSNPIYQHSGETEKFPPIAQQASINEEQEQRRRQLDKRGEQHKIIVAKEVSNLVDQFGGRVHLKSTPYTPPARPILLQAQESASNVLNSALEAGKSIINTASAAAGSAAGAVTGAAQSAVGAVSGAVTGAAQSAAGVASTVLGTASSVSHDAAAKMSSVATEAAHQASNIAAKVVDTTSVAAGVVSQKTKEIAAVTSDKALEIADNISHFTTLVAVLAEEENERARRMVSGDEARAAANAFRVSELIRDLGPDFYRQTPNLLYTTKVLEEAERRWRLNSSASELAESNAHREGKLVSKNLQSFMPRYQWVRSHISTLEEKERTRRLNDPAECWAIINALNVAFIIRELGLGFYRQEGTFSRTHAGYATTLLEENERRDRIRTEKLLHAQDSQHLLMDVVSNNIEKFSYNTRTARHFANALREIKFKFLTHLDRYIYGASTMLEFATLLGNATLRVASQFSSLTKDFAASAAERVKTVAGDLRNLTAAMYVTALEEKERARRISDPDEISAINNAWLQSQLIRDLSALYRPSSLARYPLGLIEEQERRWRLSNVTPSASRKLAAIVQANHGKFELAMERAWERERAHAEAIAHSRLNPRAPAFVPHQTLPAKAEPAPLQRANLASGAQL